MSSDFGHRERLADPAPNPGLWLGLSIVATMFCCMPFGVAGIVYAVLAMEAQGRGDHVMCAEKVASARKWTQWSFLAGLVLGGLALCLVLNGQ